MKPIQRSASTPLLAAIVIVIGLLYFFTAARDIVVGDSTELIIAAVTLGVVHPPGYPLFTMLGHLFSLIPLGPIPSRVNLLSAVCDSLTIGVVFLTAFRLSRSHLASIAAALVLALNPVFWSWSLVAEVFPLNNLLAALLIYLLVIWNDDPQRYGTLAAAAFVFGLALTNHQTVVLLSAAILFLLWRNRAVLLARPAIVIICATALLVGLIPYAYLPWAAARHPALNYGGISSFSELIAHVTRQSYGSHRLIDPVYEGGSVWPRIATLFFSFGAVMGLFAVLGMFRAYRRCRWYFWFTLLAFSFTGIFFAVISNINLSSLIGGAWLLERFFLLPQVAAAPLTALGVMFIADVLASSSPVMANKSVPIIAGALGIVLGISLITNYRQMDQSRNHVARNFAEDLLDSLESGAILFAAGDPYLIPVLYMTSVEKLRPDVTVVAIPLLRARWYIDQLRERYPELNMPFESYDGQRNNFKALIEANRGRQMALVGMPPDPSAMLDYWPYPHGLVQLIEPNSKWIGVEEYATDNEQLMKRYRIPALASIKANTFERGILFFYSFAAWQIGTKYEYGGSKAEARDWYQRAQQIDPGSEAIYRGLARGAARALNVAY